MRAAAARALLAALWLAGCDAPSPRGAAGDSTRQAGTEEAVSRAAGFLVWSDPTGFPEDWTTASAAGDSTTWLDARGAVRARRAGIWAASGARLWRWEESWVEVRALNCECVRARPVGPLGEACLGPARVREIALREVGGTGNVEFFEPVDREQQRGEAAPVQTALPSVGAGRYLFVESYDQADECGDHGWSEIFMQAIDLERGAWHSPPGEAPTPADSVAARAALTIEGEPPKEKIEFAGESAAWTAADTLALSDRYTTFIPYVLSDYGSNQHAALLPRAPRPWIRPWIHPPAPVRRYWSTHRHGARAGWSAVDSAQAGRMWAAFQSGS
jgi:hypothetical protein